MAALGIAAGGLATSLPLAGCVPAAHPGPGRPLAFLTPARWGTLDAAGRVLWPDLPGQPGAGAARAAELADRLFAGAHPTLKGEIAQLLDALGSLTWTTFRFQPFSALAPADQAAYLASWRDAPFAIQRRGFAAVARLTGMLTYMQPASWEAIGFPGPWLGRVDIGLGLDGQGAMAASPNPNVFTRWEPAS